MEKKTIIQENVGSKIYKKIILEEQRNHGPNSKILCYVTAKYGTERDITDGVLEFLEDNEYMIKLLNFTAIRWEKTVLKIAYNIDVNFFSLIRRKKGNYNG